MASPARRGLCWRLAAPVWIALGALLAVTALSAGPAAAQSPTETCVEVRTTRSDGEAIRRLVMNEIDRFPTHRSADADCGSFLRVEVIDLDGITYVTGRINTQVPHREPVTDELGDAVERMLRVVLHNDPVRLRGPRSENILRRGLNALKHGTTLIGAEVFQTMSPLDGELASLTGVAAIVRREADDWHLAARLSFAGRLSDPPAGQLELTRRIGFGLQALFFVDAIADTSFYWGFELGLDDIEVAGPSPIDGVAGTYSQTGFAVGARAGVEFFRTTTGRLDLFAQLTVPVTPTHDEDGAVVDAWLPALGVGAGLWF